MNTGASDDKPSTPRRGSEAREESNPPRHFNSEPSSQPPVYNTTTPNPGSCTNTVNKVPKSKRPAEEPYQYGESAAVIRAVCAMPSAAQIEEDKRKMSRTLRERWREWIDEFRQSNSETASRNEDPGLRPVDRGSAPRMNVWGVGVRDPNRYRPSGAQKGKKR